MAVAVRVPPMRVLVAGATGAIGRPLVRQLLESGHEVTGLTRKPERAEQLRATGAEALVCDALDADGIRRAFSQARPEVVVNELTSIPPRLNPRRMKTQFAANDRLRREGTQNLATAAVEAGAHRLVSESIAFAYAPGGEGPHDEGDPLNLGVRGGFRRAVHAIAELERITLGTPGLAGVVLRYGTLYGPGTAFADDGPSAAAVRSRLFPLAGGGDGVWSFLHVEDAAWATVRAVESEVTGVFNIVDDDPAPLREWLPRYAEALGAGPPRRMPGTLLRILAGPLAADQMTKARGASNRAARETLGWTPSVPSWREGFAEAAPAPS